MRCLSFFIAIIFRPVIFFPPITRFGLRKGIISEECHFTGNRIISCHKQKSPRHILASNMRLAIARDLRVRNIFGQQRRREGMQ